MVVEHTDVSFTFEGRSSDSPLVDMIWRTQSERGGMFMSTAANHWEMVISRYQGKTTLTVRGPETKATPAPCPDDTEFFGIVFTHGTFMPHLPTSELVDDALNLPAASDACFWLHGAAWQFPSYDNADTFVERLVRDNLLVHDPVVDAVLHNRALDLSLRSVQRRFVRATGLTRGTFDQIERARQAATLLEQGVSIADVIYRAGYADQPHLTRSVKRFVGQTPAQILRTAESE